MTEDGVFVGKMARTIRSRMAELQIPDVAKLNQMTGIARQILDDLLAGRRKNYRDHVTQRFCAAMQWESDGVAQLLKGKPPTPLLASPPADELAKLRDRVVRLEKAIETLQEISTLRAGRDKNWLIAPSEDVR